MATLLGTFSQLFFIVWTSLCLAGFSWAASNPLMLTSALLEGEPGSPAATWTAQREVERHEDLQLPEGCSPLETEEAEHGEEKSESDEKTPTESHSSDESAPLAPLLFQRGSTQVLPSQLAFDEQVTAPRHPKWVSQNQGSPADRPPEV